MVSTLEGFHYNIMVITLNLKLIYHSVTLVTNGDQVTVNFIPWKAEAIMYSNYNNIKFYAHINCLSYPLMATSCLSAVPHLYFSTNVCYK